MYNSNILFSTIQADYKTSLDRICQQLYTRSFYEAENVLLSLVKQVYDVYESPEGHTEQEILVSQVLYVEFNDYFEKWLQEKGKTQSDLVDELSKDEHENILLANCTDPASMDDLMWDLNNVLTSNPHNYVMDDIDYHIVCYKRAMKDLHVSRSHIESYN
jgi:hypothetical protein